MLIQENIQLQSLNTMATPAVARWFTVVQTVDEAIEALAFAGKEGCGVYILGEGSNTVFDGDINSLLIANRIGGAGQSESLFESSAIQLINESSTTVDIKIGGGVNWHELVKQSLAAGYYGLECLALIPGLVGASPIQNIGAYGTELSDTLQSVEAIDTKTLKLSQFSNKECQFAYRDSLFKRSKGRYLITSITLRLSKKASSYQLDELYPALRSEFCNTNDEQAISPQVLFEAVCKVRQSKLPNPKEIPNSGSFFKNPIVSVEQRDSLLKEFPALVSYPHEGAYKLAAGWLIEGAGIKGEARENGVGSYEKQALVLVNRERASGHDVVDFANYVIKQVSDKYDVTLEIEPNIINKAFFK